jgi:hypothetical protein
VGSQEYSLTSSASAEAVAQGSRTAKSSPRRHSRLSHPRAQPRRAIGEIGVLVTDQIPNQLRGDLDPAVGRAQQQ